MIKLYYWPTPNGKKISVMLEECGLPYEIVPVDIGKGDQFEPEFLAISPNNRMPAIVDTDTGISVFESGAILVYLAEKSGRFLPQEDAVRFEVLQWLFWQVAGQGPMAGQLSHFVNYAPEDVPYAKKRYGNEYDRLLGVMDRRLEDREYLAGDLSIADFAAYPWTTSYKKLGASLEEFPHLRRWFDALKARPALRRGMEVGQDLKSDLKSEEARKLLFEQTAKSTASRAGSRRS